MLEVRHLLDQLDHPFVHLVFDVLYFLQGGVDGELVALPTSLGLVVEFPKVAGLPAHGRLDRQELSAGIRDEAFEERLRLGQAAGDVVLQLLAGRDLSGDGRRSVCAHPLHSLCHGGQLVPRYEVLELPHRNRLSPSGCSVGGSSGVRGGVRGGARGSIRLLLHCG